MNITIIGTGFVGVVSAAVYSSFGNTVIGLDVDDKKIESLRQSKVPFFEPQLEELLGEQQRADTLSFTTDYKTAVPDADVIIIAVGTPSDAEGNANLSYVYSAVESAAANLKENAILVVKSTVPPGTLTKVKQLATAKTNKTFHLASLPEFLREGSAVHDTLHPDRVVIGAENDFVFQKLEELHRPLKAPILKMSPESAQMTKYTANAYLATRITFINQIADLCETNGADVQEVIAGIGLDARIGDHYWYPGLGYGGSCFPKDVHEIAQYSHSVGIHDNLFVKIHELNTSRIPDRLKRYEEVIGGWHGKAVAVLGLSFKPNTDDVREAPSLSVIPSLLSSGATVRGFDPTATYQPPSDTDNFDAYSQAPSLKDAVDKVDIIMILIEWPEIIEFDYSSNRDANRTQWIIDTRNQLEPESVTKSGFKYIATGRPETEQGTE